MKIRLFYLYVVLFFGLGLGMIWFSFPKEQELALIYLKDRQYQDAFDLYEKLYQEGDQKLNVTLPLIDLYLLYGETDKAVKLMEATLREHPELPRGNHRLAELYRANNQPADYAQTLEELLKNELNQEYLEELLPLYQEFGDNEKLIRTYERLFQVGRRDESMLYGLAFLKANNDKYQEAIEVLSSVPIEKYSDNETVYLLINLYLEQDEPQKAYLVAKKYIQFRDEPDVALMLSSPFYENNFPQLAWNLLVPYEEYIGSRPELFSTLVLYGEKIGKKDAIFKYAKELFDEGKMSFIILDNFVSLAVREKDTKTIEKVLTQADPDQLPDWVLMELLQYVVENQDNTILETLKRDVSKERVFNSPVLSVGFFLTTKPTLEEFTLFWEEINTERGFSQQEKFELATLLFNKENAAEAKVVFNSIDSLEGYTSAQIELYALIAVQVKEVEKAEEMIGQVIEKEGDSPDKIGYSLLYLAAARGETEKVIEKVVDIPEWNQTMIADLYTIAYQYKNAELALFLAKYWYDETKDLQSELALANALVLAKKYEEALPFLQNLVKRDPKRHDIIGAYLTTYIKTAKGDPVKERLFKKQLLKFLENPSIPDVQKAYWGYSLIEGEEKEYAKIVFFDLAGNKPITNEYVQTLLFLWEDHLDEEQIEWILKRAKKADLKDKAEWVLYLVGAEKPELILEIVNRDDLINREIQEAFLTTLGELSMRPCLRQWIQYILCWEEDPKQLKIIGKIALDFGVPTEALITFRKALAAAPNDPQIWRYLGYSSFQLGSYCEAFEFLNAYLATGARDFKSNYFIGQIYDAWEDKCSAHQYYNNTLHEINQLGKIEEDIEVEVLTTIASIQFKQKNEIGAFATFEYILCLHPDSLDTVADYADHLITGQFFGTAKELLDCYVTMPGCDCYQFTTKEGPALVRIYQFKARLLREIGDVLRADQLIQELMCCCESIDNKSLLFDISGEFYEQLGFFRQGICDYRQASYQNPYNEQLPKFIWDIYQPYRSFIDGFYETQITDNNLTEHRWQLEYFKRFNSGYFFHAIGAYDNYSISQFLNARNGLTESTKGVIYRSEWDLGYDFFNGDRALLGLYIGNDVFGGQASYLWRDLKGFNQFTLKYHYPSWEFAEVIANRGNVDEIQYDRLYRFNKSMRIEGFAAFRFWNMDHISNVGKSIKNIWSFIWTFDGLLAQRWFGEGGFVDLVLNYDSEYVFDQKKGTDAVGVEFDRFNLLTQETYTLLLIGNKVYNKNFHVEGFVGYSYNRFGKGGMDVGGSLVYQRPKCWELRFNASQTQSTVSPGTQQVLRVEAKVFL